jgi:DNA-binding transcriptional LysR family regulator
VSLTPAALGKKIRKLELRLGARFFQRTTRRVELTPRGSALVPRARELLTAAEACARAGRGESGPPPVEVVLGTRHELGLEWLVPQLERLRRELPHVTVHLYFGSGADLENRVRSAEIDAAITSRASRDPRLESVRLHREDYVFVAAPKLLRRAPLATAEDAAAHVLIDAHAELPLFRYWRDARGGGDRLRFARVQVIGTIEGIRRLAVDGRGVAVLPHFLVRKDLAARRLAPLFPRVRLLSDWFRLIHRADDPRRATLQTLGRVLLAAPAP